MRGIDIGEWIRLQWDFILMTPNAYGKFEIRDKKKKLVFSGEGRIKEVLSEYRLKHADSVLFFKFDVQDGEVDLDKFGYWIHPEGEEEKQIGELADSMRGYLSEETIEDFKKMMRMDFEKRLKTK